LAREPFTAVLKARSAILVWILSSLYSISVIPSRRLSSVALDETTPKFAIVLARLIY
jgi:hypothetical protein